MGAISDLLGLLAKGGGNISNFSLLDHSLGEKDILRCKLEEMLALVGQG
jgi:hypothetical protein